MPDLASRFSLQGKRALVTGASRGIGAEIATVFADAGADVAIVGRDAKGLDATRQAIAGKGRRCVAIQADLRTVEGPLNLIFLLVQPAALVATVYFLIYQATNGTWSGAGYAYQAESFPTRVRGTAVGFLGAMRERRGFRTAIESLPHRRRAAMLTRYREPVSTAAPPAARERRAR
jgi:NAD(P)-dependent dehydrogenase (short-subunit alcohol dehydrogenase family)